eukprot:SAG31_NODE_36161_length_316_cov_0.552995_1_plen_27_part_01
MLELDRCGAAANRSMVHQCAEMDSRIA